MALHDHDTLKGTTLVWVYQAQCCICGVEWQPGGMNLKQARERLRADGWKLVKGRGWHCPACKGDK